MNSTTTTLFIKEIHKSWIPFLHDLHWTGRILAWLGKGYASFKLTEEEKSKWKLDRSEINKISEILQSEIDMANSKAKITDFLKYLSDFDYIYIPNKLDSGSLVDEVKKEKPEIIKKLQKEIEPFITPLINENYSEIQKLFINWKLKDVQTTLKKGCFLIAKKLRENEILLRFPSYTEFLFIPENIQHFILLIYYYYDPRPEPKRITLFRELLLQESEVLTQAIDIILYSSWREYPNEMFQLTKSWINSGNPILIDWLVHGVEVPGRSNPLKALNFLKPAFYLSQKNVAWIISHVTTSIICADPYQTLNILEDWIKDSYSQTVREKLFVAFSNIIEDKFINNNFDEYDFPNLKNTLISIFLNWQKNSDNTVGEVANKFLDKLK